MDLSTLSDTWDGYFGFAHLFLDLVAWRLAELSLDHPDESHRHEVGA